MYNFNSGYGKDFIINAINSVSGKVFFVSNVTTGNVIDMVRSIIVPDPDGVQRFFTSLSSAVANCVANRGDLIILLPGHTETITVAGGIDLNVAGITILGMGAGSLRPTFNFTTATTADMDISSANITIDNVILDLTGIDALVAPIDVNATNFTLKNSTVITADASGQATLGILTDANAGGMKLYNNKFVGTTDAGTATAVRIVGGDEHEIVGNYFYGAYTTSLGAIENNTTACLRVRIENNVIINATASSTKAMVFVAGSSGYISNNRMQILSGTAPITGAGMSWVGGNYYAATIATLGTLI